MHPLGIVSAETVLWRCLLEQPFGSATLLDPEAEVSEDRHDRPRLCSLQHRHYRLPRHDLVEYPDLRTVTQTEGLGEPSAAVGAADGMVVSYARVECSGAEAR